VPAATNDRVGLCASCAHALTVPSSKGSVFYLCALAVIDSTFRKYPALPVIACSGYRAAAEGNG